MVDRSQQWGLVATLMLQSHHELAMLVSDVLLTNTPRIMARALYLQGLMTRIIEAVGTPLAGDHPPTLVE